MWNYVRGLQPKERITDFKSLDYGCSMTSSLKLLLLWRLHHKLYPKIVNQVNRPFLPLGSSVRLCHIIEEGNCCKGQGSCH